MQRGGIEQGGEEHKLTVRCDNGEGLEMGFEGSA
jgi:hypothetical protein